MRIAIVALRFGIEAGVLPPLGPAMLAASLRASQPDLDICIIDAARDWGVRWYSISTLAERLAMLDADIVALSVFNDAIPLVILTLDEIRTGLGNKRVYIGGPGVTEIEHALLQRSPGIAAAVRGDGESAIQLLSRPKRTSLIDPPGIYRGLIAGGPSGDGGSAREDLSSLPVPAWDLIDGIGSRVHIPVSTTRGCPFDCSFCDVVSSFGRKVSRRPRDLILQDIEHGLMHIGGSHVRLVDDTFNLSRAAMWKTCDILAEVRDNHRADLTFSAYARIDLLGEKDVDYLADSGCVRLFVGVDAVDPDSVTPLSKGYTPAQVEDAITRIAERIAVVPSMIWGFPNESMETFERGAEIMTSLMDGPVGDHVWPQFSLLSPSVGTPLYQSHKQDLLFDPDAPTFLVGERTTLADRARGILRGEGDRARDFGRMLDYLAHPDNQLFATPFYRYANPGFSEKRDRVSALMTRVADRRVASLNETRINTANRPNPPSITRVCVSEPTRTADTPRVVPHL